MINRRFSPIVLHVLPNEPKRKSNRTTIDEIFETFVKQKKHRPLNNNKPIVDDHRLVCATPQWFHSARCNCWLFANEDAKDNYYTGFSTRSWKEKDWSRNNDPIDFLFRRRNKNGVFIHALRGTYLFPSWEADRKISRKGNGKRN